MINAIAKIGEYIAGENISKEVFPKNICKPLDPAKEIKGKDGIKKQYNRINFGGYFKVTS